MLFGAVGDWKYDKLPREHRPEQAILGLRKNLGLFANLRPAILYPELASASSLKPEIVSGLDILIIRELTGDIYFGSRAACASPPTAPSRASARATTPCATPSPKIAPHRPRRLRGGAKRGKKLCCVDKANVLETSQFWRDVGHRDWRATTPTSSCRTCTSTTPPCSWCATRASST